MDLLYFILEILVINYINNMSTFYKSAYMVTKSIIAQRMLILKIDKSAIKSPTFIAQVEDLNNDFKQYSNAERPLAYFICKNYEKLKEITVKSKGFETKLNKLREAYLESKLVLNN